MADFFDNERLFAVETREQATGFNPEEMVNAGLPQPLGTTDSPTFANITVNNLTTTLNLTVTSQTQGSVWFSGAGGALTQNNSNLYFDSVNERLRIKGLETKVTTPAQITASQNDYNPGTGKRFRISSDAAWSITGLSGGTDGREITLYNVGSFDITLTNQDAASSAANRIISGTGTNIVIAANDCVELWWDSIDARWRTA